MGGWGGGCPDYPQTDAGGRQLCSKNCECPSGACSNGRCM
jgi:hypothetical protein